MDLRYKLRKKTNVRTGPSLDYPSVIVLPRKSEVVVDSIIYTNGFAKILNTDLYIYLSTSNAKRLKK